MTLRGGRPLMIALMLAICAALVALSVWGGGGARGVNTIGAGVGDALGTSADVEQGSGARDMSADGANAIDGNAVSAPQTVGSSPYIALLVTLPLIAYLSLRRKSGARGFAQSAEHKSASAVPSARFDDVAANDEAMSSLRDILSFMRDPDKYRRMGARIPRGVLLHGMPGTGKTLMARALAGEAGVPFYAANGADFVEMYVGVGASRVRALFRRARKAKSAVVFIDEIDAIGGRRDGQSEESARTLNALLSEMSGFRDSDGIVVLAATNRLDCLDEALLRAGRFDRLIEVPLPSLEERLSILKTHARNKPLSPSVDLRELAAQTALFSGAKLEGVLNEAAILAAKRDAVDIELSDVERAMATILFGGERRDAGTIDREREITAAHEAGHALLTALLLPESALHKVSIIPTNAGAAGYSMAIPPERLFHGKQELLNHMAVALAGREAERLLTGSEHVTTGASGDIEKAATLARRMVGEWGMLPASDEVYLCSQAQRDAAAQQWLITARRLALSMLSGYTPAWRRLTELLMARETLGQKEVMECLADADVAAQGICS